MIMTISYY